jgi:hypothetical protein
MRLTGARHPFASGLDATSANAVASIWRGASAHAVYQLRQGDLGVDIAGTLRISGDARFAVGGHVNWAEFEAVAGSREAVAEFQKVLSDIFRLEESE